MLTLSAGSKGWGTGGGSEGVGSLPHRSHPATRLEKGLPLCLVCALTLPQKEACHFA